MSDVAPSFFHNLPVVEQVISDSTGATDQEKALASLSRSKGWKILKEFILEIQNGLDQANKTAIANQASLEEIGRNTVIVSLAKDITSRIINKVSDAADAVEQDEQ